MTPCPVASRIFHDWSEALREASHPEHRDSEELLTSYAGAVASALDHHLAACVFYKEPTMTQHTPRPRCTNCRWVHEADSEAGTSFQGVELCQLHAAAPELLEACKLALYFVEASGNPEGHTASELRSAIAKATEASPSAPRDPDHA